VTLDRGDANRLAADSASVAFWYQTEPSGEVLIPYRVHSGRERLGGVL